LILLFLLFVSLIGAASFTFRLWDSIRHTSYLNPHPPLPTSHSPLPKVSIIIPAYNEAENIEECVRAVLDSISPDSALLPADRLDVWVVDDQSTDGTITIVQLLQQTLHDPRLNLLEGQARPTGETWMGKNWACVQGVEKAAGDFLLFLDADVRLGKGAIEAAVQTAEQEKIDLLSCGPAIICGCLAEWLVQPLMFSSILIGFNANEVNDPKSDKAFAAGPFMLFRRGAYEKIGGHRAVADQVVEDVELAKLTKQNGFTLRLLSGIKFISVRMYRSWTALWEGWTKNMFLASDRNLPASLLFVVAILLIFAVPWFALIAFLLKAIFVPLSVYEQIAIVLSAMTISMHFLMRKIILEKGRLPTHYWWLAGIGGVLVAAITIASIIKTETGWGWTWRGRSLKQQESR
jgi:cellulose synthase/poly-beta-1,6-N-acetylglucosamine synthase-like glycosyltransferase